VDSFIFQRVAPFPANNELSFYFSGHLPRSYITQLFSASLVCPETRFWTFCCNRWSNCQVSW